MQVDPRLPQEVQQQATERMLAQTNSRVTDADAASGVLADMYCALTKRGAVARPQQHSYCILNP